MDQTTPPAPGISLLDYAAVLVELLSATEVLVESYGYVDYTSDEEKEADPDVMHARVAIKHSHALLHAKEKTT